MSIIVILSFGRCALLAVRIRLFVCLELGARGLLTETGVICIIYLLPTGVFGSEGGGRNSAKAERAEVTYM